MALTVLLEATHRLSSCERCQESDSLGGSCDVLFGERLVVDCGSAQGFVQHGESWCLPSSFTGDTGSQAVAHVLCQRMSSSLGWHLQVIMPLLRDIERWPVTLVG